MLSMMRLAILFLLLAVTSPGFAQDDPAAVAARVGPELSCVEAKKRRLDQTVQLLREARDQLTSTTEAAVRRDAARTVEALEERLASVAAELAQCVPASARRRAAGEPEVVPPPPDAVADRVGTANDATEIVERDARLSGQVFIAVGERVDGRGQLAASTVRSMVRGVGARIDACYGSFLDRNAMTTGELILSFTISGSGRVGQVEVEGQDLPDRTFRHCLREAGQRLRSSSSPRGGSVQYAYTLRFGRR